MSAFIVGDPHWELLARLRELCGVHTATFSVEYASQENTWKVTIVGLPDLSPIEFTSSDFDSAVLLAVSSAETAL